MTLLEQCRAALPGDWHYKNGSAVLEWPGLYEHTCRLRVCHASESLYLAKVLGTGGSFELGAETPATAIAACIAQARASLGPLLPPDPLGAIAESMAGSLTGGVGRHVTEWRTEAGLLRVTVEVEK